MVRIGQRKGNAVIFPKDNSVILTGPASRSTPQITSNVKEWSTWSLQPHSQNEIREKILTDYQNVCFTYLCDTQEFTESFLEEVMVLSTGWFDKGNYSAPAVAAAINQFRAWRGKGEKDSLYDPDWRFQAACRNTDMSRSPGSSYYEVSHKDIYEKIDWASIAKRFRFSKAFEKRYNLVRYRPNTQPQPQKLQKPQKTTANNKNAKVLDFVKAIKAKSDKQSPVNVKKV
jgi:hypothetical protein